MENRVLRKIFGPKREKTKGEWRRLHTEGLTASMLLPTKYFSGYQIKSNEMGGVCSTYREENM